MMKLYALRPTVSERAQTNGAPTSKDARAPSQQACERTDAGYTLLELLVVLAIMGLLVAIAAPRVMRVFEHSKTKTAQIQIANLSGALDLYRLDIGSYPTQQQGLKALLTAPANSPNWAGPYLTRADGLTDPWTHPYIYRRGSSLSPEILSLGADGKPGGTGDDKDLSNQD